MCRQHRRRDRVHIREHTGSYRGFRHFDSREKREFADFGARRIRNANNCRRSCFPAKNRIWYFSRLIRPPIPQLRLNRCRPDFVIDPSAPVMAVVSAVFEG